MKKIFWLVFLSSILFCCRKDLEEFTLIESSSSPPVVRIVGSVVGKIVNEWNEPIMNATVQILEQTTQTTEGGYFFLSDIPLDANGTLVRVTKDGGDYFPGFYRFYPNAGNAHYCELKLFSIDQSIALNTERTSDGILVNALDGAKILFEPGSVEGAEEDDYSVAIKWINPNRPDLRMVTPGSLTGIDSQNDQVALGTYGMLAIELLGPSGNSLNLKEGATATLYFPVPVELRNTAPATIPLWHFDEELGLWIEEGQAALEGDFYVGKVSHFSFWNCDVPYPLVDIRGTVLDSNGLPVTNSVIEIIANERAGFGTSDSKGIFKGKVPKGEPLTIIVKQGNNTCNQVLYEGNIGPFDVDTDIGTIMIEDTERVEVNIKGTLIDCNNNPISRGIIEVNRWSDNLLINTNWDGTFDNTLFLCKNRSIELNAVNLDTKEIRDSLIFNDETSIDLGEVKVCDEFLNTFIRVSFDDNDLVFINVQHDSILILQDSLITGLNKYDYLTSAINLSDKSYKLIIGMTEFVEGQYSNEATLFTLEVYDGPALRDNLQSTYACFYNPGCEDFSIEISQDGGTSGPTSGFFQGNILRFDGPSQIISDERTVINGDFQILKSF